MSYTIRFSELASRDLMAIDAWVAQEADEATAAAYVARIERFCAKLSEFPNRGTPRNEIGAGVRSLSFERRIIILYQIQKATVRILRVSHGARKLDALWLE